MPLVRTTPGNESDTGGDGAFVQGRGVDFSGPSSTNTNPPWGWVKRVAAGKWQNHRGPQGVDLVFVTPPQAAQMAVVGS